MTTDSRPMSSSTGTITTFVMPHMQNTTHVIYRMVQGDGPRRLHVRPSLHMRPHDGGISRESPSDYTLNVSGIRCEIRPSRDLPILRV